MVEHMKDLDIIWAIPLKDNLVDREIAYYFWTKRLTAIPGPRLVPLSVSQTKSINGLTNNFLMNLQRGFDHSMHTVMRSLEKLSSDPTYATLPESGEPTSPKSPKSSSSSATAPDATPSGTLRCSLCTRLRSPSEHIAHSTLCFSCEKMLFSYQEEQTGMVAPENPVLTSLLNFQQESVLAPAVERTPVSERQHQVSKVSRKQMREQIQEFLLDREEDADLG